jgi:hypothetical protein
MPYSAEEKAKEARREVTYRQFVYSRRLAAGTMREAEAKKKIAIMTEIAEDYEKLAEKERLL